VDVSKCRLRILCPSTCFARGITDLGDPERTVVTIIPSKVNAAAEAEAEAAAEDRYRTELKANLIRERLNLQVAEVYLIADQTRDSPWLLFFEA